MTNMFFDLTNDNVYILLCVEYLTQVLGFDKLYFFWYNFYGYGILNKYLLLLCLDL